MKKALIVLLDVVTPELGKDTRLDTIKASMEYLELDEPIVGPCIPGTPFAPVTWLVEDGPDFRTLRKYMDETDAAYVVHPEPPRRYSAW